MRGSNTTTTSHATTNDTAAAATASEKNDDDDDDDIRARTILQNATTLRPTDGNIQQELHVLEDTIDNLLSVHRGRHHDASSALEQRYTNYYTASSSTSTSQDFHQPDNQNK